MACIGDNVGSFRDEESSSSSYGVFGEVLSRADANKVLTWLRPTRKPQADAFWKRFSFPPQVRVYFSSSGP